MSIVVEGGDWKRGRRVRIHDAFLKGPTAISLPTGLAFGMERIAKANLASVRLVTEQMRNEALSKVGAGVVGGVLLGPLGLIAGAVIGRGQKSQLVILETTDGRSALLRCKPSDLRKLLALGVGSKTPPAAQQSAPASALTTPAPARQLLASAPARWALEGVGWIAAFLVIGISMVTQPVIGLGLCLLAVLLGGAIWWRRELRSRLGAPRAVGLAVIGFAFLLPVLFYSIAGVPLPGHDREVSAAVGASAAPSVAETEQPATAPTEGRVSAPPASSPSPMHELQVTKEAFEAQDRVWPFEVSSGTVGCELPMRALWFQAPDGRRFALNGTASSHLGLPWPDPIWLQDMRIARAFEQQFERWPSPEESGRLTISDVIRAADRACIS